jgi:hypothetical protein
MQQSSSSIGSLAAALARAQVELVNPEKSMLATIRDGKGGAEQIFRYAPLSSGLDIVLNVRQARDRRRAGNFDRSGSRSR